MAVKLVIDKDPLIIKIPMKPYLVKFLTNKYGAFHKASKTSLLGLQAIELLTDEYSKPLKSDGKHFFTLKVPFTLCNKYGHFVDHAKVPVFQKKVDKLFKDLLVDHISINCNVSNHGEAIRSIRNFFSYYNISEEDFSLDYAYKLMQRNEERKLQIRQNNNKAFKSAC